jgi:hypothetical protein
MSNAPTARRYLWAVALLGCGFGDTPFEELGPITIVGQPTWADHVAPRIEYYCLACHDPEAQGGIRGGWDFSNCAAVLGAIEVIRQEAVVERSMPPGARDKISAEDWAVIKRWSEGDLPCFGEAK